jgi:hypothetical protein
LRRFSSSYESSPLISILLKSRFSKRVVVTEVLLKFVRASAPCACLSKVLSDYWYPTGTTYSRLRRGARICDGSQLMSRTILREPAAQPLLFESVFHQQVEATFRIIRIIAKGSVSIHSRAIDYTLYCTVQTVSKGNLSREYDRIE